MAVASAPPLKRAVGFPASIAEFLLLFRLRARSRSALCAEMLERAAQVVLVTCSNWFATAAGHAKNSPLSRH